MCPSHSQYKWLATNSFEAIFWVSTVPVACRRLDICVSKSRSSPPLFVFEKSNVSIKNQMSNIDDLKVTRISWILCGFLPPRLSGTKNIFCRSRGCLSSISIPFVRQCVFLRNKVFQETRCHISFAILRFGVKPHAIERDDFLSNLFFSVLVFDGRSEHLAKTHLFDEVCPASVINSMPQFGYFSRALGDPNAAARILITSSSCVVGSCNPCCRTAVTWVPQQHQNTLSCIVHQSSWHSFATMIVQSRRRCPHSMEPLLHSNTHTRREIRFSAHLTRIKIFTVVVRGDLPRIGLFEVEKSSRWIAVWPRKLIACMTVWRTARSKCLVKWLIRPPCYSVFRVLQVWVVVACLSTRIFSLSEFMQALTPIAQVFLVEGCFFDVAQVCRLFLFEESTFLTKTVCINRIVLILLFLFQISWPFTSLITVGRNPCVRVFLELWPWKSRCRKLFFNFSFSREVEASGGRIGDFMSLTWQVCSVPVT